MRIEFDRKTRAMLKMRIEQDGKEGRGEDGRLATSRFRSGESREAGDA